MTEVELIRFIQFLLMAYVAYWAINMIAKPFEWFEKRQKKSSFDAARLSIRKAIDHLRDIETEDAEALSMRDKLIANAENHLKVMDTLSFDEINRYNMENMYLHGKLEERIKWLNS